MSLPWFIVALRPSAASPAGEGSEPSFHNDPVATYERRRSHGFTILVSHRLRDQPGDATASWDELARQLGEIARVVPPGPLGRLRQVPIWLEWAETRGLGEFHWGPEPLVAMGRNPAKARGVEITNARHLVEWSTQQPWAVLHELSHAYHCIVLGRADGAVIRTYKQAVRSGRYTRVASVHGGQQVAYALTNSAEYFAELTEAYFGKNDFEPFNHADLARFDPPGYRLMTEVWGVPGV